MRDALADENLDQVARLIGEEWEARRRLAPAVSSPEIERILEAALAAGGEAGKRERAEEAIRGAGGSVLAFHVDASGLQLDPSSEVS
jgi:galactokinase/mevalonate kinase-like predicted kinase